MISGAANTVHLRVASLPDFLVMKAHAIGGRDKPKDVYDLCYCLDSGGSPDENEMHARRAYELVQKLLRPIALTAAVSVYVCRNFAKSQTKRPLGR